MIVAAAAVIWEVRMSEKAPEQKRGPSPLDELRDRITHWLDSVLNPPVPVPVPVRVRSRR